MTTIAFVSYAHPLPPPQVYFLLLDQLGLPLEASPHVQSVMREQAAVKCGRGRSGCSVNATLDVAGWEFNIPGGGPGGVPVHAVSQARVCVELS